MDGTRQFSYQIQFTNSAQEDVELRDGFYAIQVSLEWYFDALVVAGEFSPMSFNIEYGIGEFKQGGVFFEAVLQGTIPDARYFRESMIRFPPTTSSHTNWYFRLNDADDRFEVLNNAIGTRTEDMLWRLHLNPGNIPYVVREFYEVDAVYLGIVELRPGTGQ